MQPRPEINLLLLELVEAHRKARREDLADALDACGLRQHSGPIVGVEFVASDAHYWAPEPGGKPALVIPHFEEGRLLDHVAMGLQRYVCNATAYPWAMAPDPIRVNERR